MLFNIVDSEKQLIEGTQVKLDVAEIIENAISAGDFAKVEPYWVNNNYVIKGSRCLLMHKYKGYFYTVSLGLHPEFGDCHAHISSKIQGTLITSKINHEILYFIRSFMGR